MTTIGLLVDVVDATGAGDVFHGAYLVGLLRGWGLRSVAQSASAVSAIKCTWLGGRPDMPRLSEVVAFFRGCGWSCPCHKETVCLSYP